MNNEKLTIVFVCDDYDDMNTGGVITASRFTEVLRSMGHTVRIIAPGVPMKDKYIIPTYNPNNWIMKICRSQGITMAKPDKNVIREALTGASVVYLLISTPSSYATMKIAREMGIPVVAGFHVLPENATYTLHLGWCKPLSNFIFYLLKWMFYNKVHYIHCPTKMVEDLLVSYHYKAHLYQFSNGTVPFFHPIEIERLPELKDKFVIISVGRLSNEKNQGVLIKAVERSKYSKHYQIILAGQGPNEKKYKKLAKNLQNPMIVGFYNHDTLRNMLNMSDLYVHCAIAEIESMSCTEAFSCGVVPLISKSKMSATKQFALTDNNLFDCNNIDDLTMKLDYWYEHPIEKQELSKKYLELSKVYSIQYCAEKMVQMYRDAINDPNETTPKRK